MEFFSLYHGFQSFLVTLDTSNNRKQLTSQMLLTTARCQRSLPGVEAEAAGEGAHTHFLSSAEKEDLLLSGVLTRDGQDWLGQWVRGSHYEQQSDNPTGTQAT